MTAQPVARLIEDFEAGGALRDALPDDLAEALGRPASFRPKLGKALSKRAGTRFGDAGLRVERAGQDSRSTAFSWRVLVDAEVQG